MDDVAPSPFPQKRLACFGCRDKKLRCETDRGDRCQRCTRKGLSCVRPESKRQKRRLSSQASPETPPSARFEHRRHVRALGRDKGRWAHHRIAAASQELAPALVPAASGESEADLAPIESAERLFWSTLSRRKEKTSGLFSPRLDNAPSLDPILSGVIDDAEAERLFRRFHDTAGRTLAYFDTALCTFGYVRRNSHALLCAMCLTVARVERGSETLAEALEAHVDRVVLPAVLLQDLRSVEIVQALTMLAAFQKPSDDVREDRAWTLLGHAVRVASELNLQASLYEDAALFPRQADEADCRLRRNAERAYINLWLHEVSLAQHTGRRSVVVEQPLASVCQRWHLAPYACAADRALVSMVELRTLAMRNRRLHDQLRRAAMPTDHGGATACYVERCRADLAAWSRAWLDDPCSATMPRLELATLYVDHALVQLLGLALHHLAPAEWAADIILSLYEACLGYLAAFPRLLPPAKLVHCYNSFFVAASYQTAVAMRLADLAPRFGFVDVATIRRLCDGVAACLDGAAAASASASTAAHSYARFVRNILQPQRRSVSPSRPTNEGAAMAIDTPSLTATTAATTPLFDMDSSSLGFENLEWLAWAGASSAQQDALLADLFSFRQ